MGGGALGVRVSWWVPLDICLGLVAGGFAFSWMYDDYFGLGVCLR